MKKVIMIKNNHNNDEAEETRTHLWTPPPAPVSRLSAQRSSNMRRRRWTARLISIALYWMYSSVFNRDWGRRHQTYEPTAAPAIAMPFQIQRGMKIDHHDQWITCKQIFMQSFSNAMAGSSKRPCKMIVQGVEMDAEL